MDGVTESPYRNMVPHWPTLITVHTHRLGGWCFKCIKNRRIGSKHPADALSHIETAKIITGDKDDMASKEYQTLSFASDSI